MTLLFNTTDIIAWGGVGIIALLIFAETGVLLGLIIPGGETLVFTSGILVSTDTLNINIYLMLGILIAAGLLGDMSGYLIGKKYSEKLLHKKDTWYFRKKYLIKAQTFFVKHKGPGIILGKFLPIIRPFTPLMSGATAVRMGTFISLTVLSVLLYMCTFLFLGYFLARKYPSIQNSIGWILPISIGILLIPTILQILKNRRKTA